MTAWKQKWGMRRMNDKLMSALSLCRKAGKLRMGTDVVKEEVGTGGAALVLVAADVAERTERQIRFVCEHNKVKVCKLPYSMEDLWQITGKQYGVYAVCDRGFAKMISGLIPGES